MPITIVVAIANDSISAPGTTPTAATLWLANIHTGCSTSMPISMAATISMSCRAKRRSDTR
jgi:hypothetical protein